VFSALLLPRCIAPAAGGPTIWERILRHKAPVIEPRDSGAFAAAIADYQAKLDDPTGGGAVLFAVCRGKVCGCFWSGFSVLPLLPSLCMRLMPLQQCRMSALPHVRQVGVVSYHNLPAGLQRHGVVITCLPFHHHSTCTAVLCMLPGAGAGIICFASILSCCQHHDDVALVHVQAFEGIDFSDRAGRGDVITGLPFPAAPPSLFAMLALLRFISCVVLGIAPRIRSVSSASRAASTLLLCLCVHRSPRALTSVTGQGVAWSSQACRSQPRTTPT
jgi:regulator of telomere elongation helicase 1